MRQIVNEEMGRVSKTTFSQLKTRTLSHILTDGRAIWQSWHCARSVINCIIITFEVIPMLYAFRLSYRYNLYKDGSGRIFFHFSVNTY